MAMNVRWKINMLIESNDYTNTFCGRKHFSHGHLHIGAIMKC